MSAAPLSHWPWSWTWYWCSPIGLGFRSFTEPGQGGHYDPECCVGSGRDAHQGVDRQSLVDLQNRASEDNDDFWFLIQAKAEPTATDEALMAWMTKTEI